MNYRVFARINAGDDVLDIGGVQASTDRLARVYAYRMYDEEDWDYLAVVREDHIIEVDVENPPSEPVGASPDERPESGGGERA